MLGALLLPFELTRAPADVAHGPTRMAPAACCSPSSASSVVFRDGDAACASSGRDVSHGRFRWFLCRLDSAGAQSSTLYFVHSYLGRHPRLAAGRFCPIPRIRMSGTINVAIAERSAAAYVVSRRWRLAPPSLKSFVVGGAVAPVAARTRFSAPPWSAITILGVGDSPLSFTRLLNR